MKRLHDDVVWLFAMKLRQDGHRIATEVGIPGGRIDAVRLDEADTWVELYEVKLRVPESGLGQLVTYARYLDVPPQRTLVVPPELASDELSAATNATGARLAIFDYRRGVQMSFVDDWRRAVYLPYIHPESSARIAALNREWNRKWQQQRAAA